MKPSISVIMSVYNGERYLRASINSILSQSFEDYEFIIIDDASTDSSRDIIESYSDSRIRLFSNRMNRGLAWSLNRAWAEARAPLVARHDADDIAIAGRLTIQHEYMSTHPKCILLGAQPILIDANDRITNTVTIPTQPQELHWQLLFGNAFVHSSVMMRTNRFRQLGLQYNPAIRSAQDYDLWSSLLFHQGLRNLPDFLVQYRIHSAGTSINRYESQAAIRKSVSTRVLQQLLPSLSDRDALLLQYIYRGIMPLQHPPSNLFQRWQQLLDAYSENMRSIIGDISSEWIQTTQRVFDTNIQKSERIMQAISPYLESSCCIGFYPLTIKTLGLVEGLRMAYPAEHMCLISDHPISKNRILDIPCCSLDQLAHTSCNVICLTSDPQSPNHLDYAKTVFQNRPLINIGAYQGMLSTFVQQYVREHWKNLNNHPDLPANNTARVVIYGGGLHTIWLEQICSDISMGPEVIAVIDDNPRSGHIFWKHRITRPEKITNEVFDAIVLSTDQPAVAKKMKTRCHDIFGDQTPVLYLYEQLPSGPYPKQFLTLPGKLL